MLQGATDSANAVVQALAYLGKTQIDTAVVAQFAKRIDDQDMKTLLRARLRLPGWMADVALKFEAARHG